MHRILFFVFFGGVVVVVVVDHNFMCVLRGCRFVVSMWWSFAPSHRRFQ